MIQSPEIALSVPNSSKSFKTVQTKPDHARPSGPSSAVGRIQLVPKSEKLDRGLSPNTFSEIIVSGENGSCCGNLCESLNSIF